jgi:hypothetical protein
MKHKIDTVVDLALPGIMDECFLTSRTKKEKGGAHKLGVQQERRRWRRDRRLEGVINRRAAYISRSATGAFMSSLPTVDASASLPMITSC